MTPDLYVSDVKIQDIDYADSSSVQGELLKKEDIDRANKKEDLHRKSVQPEQVRNAILSRESVLRLVR